MTIMLEGLSPLTKISQLKVEALAALKADVATDSLDAHSPNPPQLDVQTTDDFELCRAIKEKGRLTGAYEIVDYSKSLREAGFSGWESLFFRFKDKDTGALQDVVYIPPPVNDEEPPIEH